MASIRSHAATLFGFLAIMWFVEIFDQLTPFFHFDSLGIRPRHVMGLIGILTAPFLHGGFSHLIANSIPFLVLGGVVMLGGRQVFWGVTLFAMAAGGLGVWLFAGPGIHIGASGLIFGYLGFLLSRGFFERSAPWILVSLGILLLYGGLVFGLLPGQKGISWHGHFFGFAAGIAAAWLMFPGGKSLYQNGNR